MDSVDGKYVLASFAINVAPFALAYAVSFLPTADPDVARWFAPFGRLAERDLPVVRAHLDRTKRTRRLGLLVGGLAAFVHSLFSAELSRAGLGRVVSPLFLLLIGYCAGAVSASCAPGPAANDPGAQFSLLVDSAITRRPGWCRP